MNRLDRSESFKKFVIDHLHEDVNKLRLKYHGNNELMTAIDQIDCRQRTASKLRETLQRCPDFIFPSLLSSEQASSDILAAFHASLIKEDASVLDMTCGLGIDSFHFALKGCTVKAFDLNPAVAECAAYNASQLNLTSLSVSNADSVEHLMRYTPDSFDCIFIDPARRGASGCRLFALSDCQPDVVELLDKMLEVAPMVIIKASPMLDVSQTLADLHNVSDIIATGTVRECKELLIICKRNHKEAPTIQAVTFGMENPTSISFKMEEERDASPTFGLPSPGDILYEPYPATIKSAPLRLLSSRYSTVKIAPNSHLYHSSEPVEFFPGKAYRIIEVTDFSKKSIKHLTSTLKNADITCRNFPLQPAELAKRLKLRSGNGYRLFASRDCYNHPILILSQPII